MKLKIGDKISWVSYAGNLTGTIYINVLDLNAALKTIPWIDIKIEDRLNGVRLCATDSYLKMMRVQPLGV
jgi:hypothetical protein